MAAGRRPKFNMPILARINSLHQNYVYSFWNLNSISLKKIDRPIFGRSAAMPLNKTARHMGPFLNEMANFCILYTLPPLQFDIVQENDVKSQHWSNLGRLANTPICPKLPAL